MNIQNKAYIYALAAVLLWSTVASAFKLTLRRTDFMTLLFYSSFFSTLMLFAVLIVQGKVKLLWRTLRFGWRVRTVAHDEPDLAQRTGGESRRAPRSLAWSIIGGFLNPFLYYIVLFKAYSLLPAQEAQPLNYTWPVVLSLLAVPVLGEKIGLQSLLALLISFAGVVVISTRGDILGLRPANPLGASLALGSSLIWASFWLMNVKDSRDPVLKLFLNFLFGFLFIAATVFLLGRVGTTGGNAEIVQGTRKSSLFLAYALLPRIDMPGLLGCAYVGLFEMGLTFVLWLKALSLTEVTARVSNLIFLSPFISLVFIKFVVGEEILLSSIAGLSLIVGGVLLQRSAK